MFDPAVDAMSRTGPAHTTSTVDGEGDGDELADDDGDFDDDADGDSADGDEEDGDEVDGDGADALDSDGDGVAVVVPDSVDSPGDGDADPDVAAANSSSCPPITSARADGDIDDDAVVEGDEVASGKRRFPATHASGSTTPPEPSEVAPAVASTPEAEAVTAAALSAAEATGLHQPCVTVGTTNPRAVTRTTREAR